MTRAEAIEILKKLIEAMQGHVTVLPTPERIAAIRLAIASLETDEAYQLEYEKPTTKNDLGVDCVSRVDVLNNLANIAKVKAKSDAQKSLMGRCMFMVERMPSVTPQEPKTGHWEYGYAFADGNYCKCSECKEIIKCIYPMHYCPNCGCRMVEPQKSEDKA